MQEVFSRLQQEKQFDVVILSLQHLCNVTDINRTAQFIAQELIENLGLQNITINTSASLLLCA